MADLYTLDVATQTLTTKTVRMVGQTVNNAGNLPYEVIIEDLCHCMVAAVQTDDGDGKLAIAGALWTVLGVVLQPED